MRARGYLFLGCLLIFIVIGLLLAMGGGEGATITVDDDGPADYGTIQAAIDGASDGDTVLVNNGTYMESIIIDKQISLNGWDNATTLINGSEDSHVIMVQVDNVNISGFTVQGGGEVFSALCLDRSANSVINNVTLQYSYNGLFLYDSHFCTITRNTINGNRRGIYLDRSDDNVISGNKIHLNIYTGALIRNSEFNEIKANHIISNYNPIPGMGLGGLVLRGVYYRSEGGITVYTDWPSSFFATGNNISSNIIAQMNGT